MNIIVAGTKKEVAEGLTIAQLIVDEKVENPDYVTVTVNDDFVDQDQFAATTLKENDSVEFLYFMGGGSF
ncbi:MAG: sulfur carrier protein ThiS [Eubacterium sp.]|nr:sulfur carrier protein ThiS [Eubacterium sp.]